MLIALELQESGTEIQYVHSRYQLFCVGILCNFICDVVNILCLQYCRYTQGIQVV